MTELPVVDGSVVGDVPLGARTRILAKLVEGVPTTVCQVYLPGETMPQILPSLEERRGRVKAANLERRIAFEQAGIAYTFADGDGVAQTRNERDLVNINGIVTNALIAKAAGVVDPVLPFRDEANVTHSMTPDQAIAFGIAIGSAIAGAYQKKWDIDAAIDALPNIAAVQAFDLDAAWAA